MKIAFISQPWNDLRPPVQAGSIAILTYQVARRLASQADVTIYAKGEGLNSKPVYNQRVIYRWVNVALDKQWHKLLRRFTKGNSEDALVSSRYYHLGYILQIALDLKRRQIDIAHIPNFSQFAPIIKKIYPEIKIVLHMECDWLTQFDSVIVEESLESVDLIVGCSKHITERIQAAFPAITHRCETVYNAVDVHVFTEKSAGPTEELGYAKQQKLTFVGRVSPEKGVHTLISAMREVVLHFPQAHLDIIGPTKPAPFEFIVGLSQDPKVLDLAKFYEGDYFADMKAVVEEHLPANVTFSGPIPHSQLVKKYQNSDIFIFPSVWNEPFGIPLIEAMAAGVPVVSTLGGAFPEIVVEGKTGLLVERENTEALARAILQILADESLQREMGKSGRQRAVQQFSYEIMANSFLTRYKRLLTTGSVQETYTN